MNNPRMTAKDKGLLKGAARRVFSRSDLRRQALSAYSIEHSDPNHPRVTKWLWCPECGLIYPKYLSQVDHVIPVIKTHETLDDLTWDTLFDRLWCTLDNLRPMDKDCHKNKTKAENKERRKLKGNKK